MTICDRVTNQYFMNEYFAQNRIRKSVRLLGFLINVSESSLFLRIKTERKDFDFGFYQKFLFCLQRYIIHSFPINIVQ